MKKIISIDFSLLHAQHPFARSVLKKIQELSQIRFFIRDVKNLLFPFNHAKSDKSGFYYSVRRLFIGLAIAAFIAWKPTVSIAIAIAEKPANANTQKLTLV